MNTQQLAAEIVSALRKSIQSTVSDLPEADPWNEFEGGAGWLDNELSMATEYLQSYFVTTDYPDWESFRTVRQIEGALSTLPLVHLRFIKYFVERGGSSNALFFDLRQHARFLVENWLNSIIESKTQ